MTSKPSRKGLLAAAVIFLVIVVDQWIKIWIKTHFYLGEDYEIASRFHLVFVENPGMAFGLEIGGKLFLSIFRIVAVAGLTWLLCRVCSRKFRMPARSADSPATPGKGAPVGLVVCLALITAGAAGNIFDSLFYGMIFDNPSPPAVAQFTHFGDGYAPIFYGRVVDMFYFPLFSFTWPEWLPWIGGNEFLFFQPVFNFADAAISVGVIALLIFYNRFLTGDAVKAAAPADDLPDGSASDRGSDCQ